jgi:hypothetical protein
VEVIHQVAHGKALPPEVVEQIVAKTDGVPLLVEELTKMALASSLLQELKVERNWFRRTFANEGAPPYYRSDADPNGAFNNAGSADVEEALATWRAECAYARTVVASFGDLDKSRRNETRPGRPSVRWVLVHMIEEYARHNGHADLLREGRSRRGPGQSSL